MIPSEGHLFNLVSPAPNPTIVFPVRFSRQLFLVRRNNVSTATGYHEISDFSFYVSFQGGNCNVGSLFVRAVGRRRCCRSGI